MKTAFCLLVSISVSRSFVTSRVTIRHTRACIYFSARCSSTCLPSNYLLVTAHRSSIMPLTTLWALPRLPATLSPWMCKWIQARLLVIKLLQLVPLVGRLKPACIRIFWVQIAPGLVCLFSFLRCVCGTYITMVSFLYPGVVTPCFRTS
jgi:hypothetical protein